MSDQSRTQNVTIDYDFKHTAKKIEIGWDDQYHPMDFSGGAWRGTFRGTLVVDGVVANPTKGLEIHVCVFPSHFLLYYTDK